MVDFRQGKNIVEKRDLWWTAEPARMFKEVNDTVNYLDEVQVRQRAMNLMNYRLYGNAELLGMTNRSFNRINAGPDHRVTLNVIQSICDTMVSIIASNKPKPTFLTSGGNFEQQRRAKRLDRFVQGIFYNAKYYERQKEAVRDATVWGIGPIKIYKDGPPGKRRICMDRVISNEIKIDEAEAIYGFPRQMHQVRYFPREQLLELYRKDKAALAAIKTCKAANEEDNALRNSPYNQTYNMIKVIESWHLPSGPEAEDGVHLLSCETGNLLEPEPYTKDYFPFVFYKWKPRLLGFWPQGISEQLWGIQTEVNKILRTIQIAMHLGSIPKIFVEMNSKINASQLNNEIGGVIKYSGLPPKYEALQAVSPELFRQLDWLYQRAYEIIGVSQLSAQSRKPAGLDSRPALREYNDIGTQRFMIEGQRLEEMCLEAARQCIDLAKEIDEEEDDGYSVLVETKKSCEQIAWKEVNLEAEVCVMKIFPTSILPTTPEGKRQAIDEMVQMGYIDRTQALKLMDSPDLEGFYNYQNAAIEDIERTIEEILDGRYMPPEPMQNLALGIQMMTSSYLRAKADKAPRERLGMMLQWIATAQKMLEFAQQGNLQTAPPPAGAASIAPGTPPDQAAAQAALAAGLNPQSTLQ